MDETVRRLLELKTVGNGARASTAPVKKLEYKEVGLPQSGLFYLQPKNLTPPVGATLNEFHYNNYEIHFRGDHIHVLNGWLPHSLYPSSSSGLLSGYLSQMFFISFERNESVYDYPKGGVLPLFGNDVVYVPQGFERVYFTWACGTYYQSGTWGFMLAGGAPTLTSGVLLQFTNGARRFQTTAVYEKVWRAGFQASVPGAASTASLYYPLYPGCNRVSVAVSLSALVNPLVYNIYVSHAPALIQEVTGVPAVMPYYALHHLPVSVDSPLLQFQVTGGGVGETGVLTVQIAQDFGNLQ